MQCHTASLDWNEHDEVKTAIQEHAADKEADEGIAIFNKVISKPGGNIQLDSHRVEIGSGFPGDVKSALTGAKQTGCALLVILFSKCSHLEYFK